MSSTNPPPSSSSSPPDLPVSSSSDVASVSASTPAALPAVGSAAPQTPNDDNYGGPYTAPNTPIKITTATATPTRSQSTRHSLRSLLNRFSDPKKNPTQTAAAAAAGPPITPSTLTRFNQQQQHQRRARSMDSNIENVLSPPLESSSDSTLSPGAAHSTTPQITPEPGSQPPPPPSQQQQQPSGSNSNDVTPEESPPQSDVLVAPSMSPEPSSPVSPPPPVVVVDPSEVLDWSCKSLRVVGVDGGWSLYHTITTLLLHDNDLTTLVKQGIEGMPSLHTLDLRRNRLSGFGDTLLVLSQCRNLKHVYLHQATRDNVTNNISLYTDFVFQSLRGLETCDDVVSKVTIHLNKNDQTAFEFIHLLSGGMSENQLLRCDLSNRCLPSHLFFFLLSALYQLKVAWLKLDGNEWSTLNSYTNCVIFYLGKHLLYLDEEEITHQRLHLALKAQSESKIKLCKISWEECYEEGLQTCKEYVEECRKNEEVKKENQERRRIMRQLPATHDDGEEEEDEEDEETRQDGTNLNGKTTTGGAESTKRKTSTTKVDSTDPVTNGGGGGFNLHIPGRGFGAGPMPGSTTNSISSHSSNVGIDTQLSNKIEILIHYLQVYGLILLSSIHIDWPDAFYTFSEWVRIFTLNIDRWFSFLPFQQNIFFWSASFFPLFLVFLFWRISRLRGNLEEWIDSYILEWSRTKWTVFAVYMVFVTLGVIFAMLFMGNPVYRGMEPNSSNLTAALSFAIFPTLIGLVWYLMIRKFRKGYFEDTSLDKDKFRGDWLSKINIAQWLCLFMITNTFMPVSRVILKQFQCSCDGEGDINHDTGDLDICYATIDSSKRCFPKDYTATQIAAFILGLIYLIGIPSFYYVLITRTVTLVLSTSRQYKLLTQEIRRMEALPKTDRSRLSSDLQEYRRIQYKLYYCIVNNPLNSVPASSLFAAYQERYKYTKLFQMFQKVGLVIVALFIPDRLGNLEQGGQIVWASVIIILYLILLLIMRPYNDPLDDAMDIVAEAGNTTNILVVMSLAYNASWLDDHQANILLFVANGVILASFIMAFIISPLKTYWNRKKLREKIKAEEMAEEDKIQAIVDNVQKLKQRRVASLGKISLVHSEQQHQHQRKMTTSEDTIILGEVGIEPKEQDAIIDMTHGVTSDKKSNEKGPNGDGDGDAGTVAVIGAPTQTTPISASKPVNLPDSAVAPTDDKVSQIDGMAGPSPPHPIDQVDGVMIDGDVSPTSSSATHLHVVDRQPCSKSSPTPTTTTLRSPFSHTTTTSSLQQQQPRHISVHVGDTLEPPQRQQHRTSINNLVDRRRSISATMPIAGGRIGYGSISTVGRSSMRPSLATLAELFNATSPATANGSVGGLQSPAWDHHSRHNQDQHTITRGGGGGGESSLINDHTSLNEHSPAGGGHMSLGLTTTPNGVSTTIDNPHAHDFDTQFTRSPNELSRVRHLALLKLCSPSSSAHRSSNLIGFGNATSARHDDSSRNNMQQFGGTPIGYTPSIVRTSYPNHHTMPASMHATNSRTRANSYDLRHVRFGSTSGGSSGAEPIEHEGSHTHHDRASLSSSIDISLSPRAYQATVVLTPTTAAALRRLEQSAVEIDDDDARQHQYPRAEPSPSALDTFILPHRVGPAASSADTLRPIVPTSITASRSGSAASPAGSAAAAAATSPPNHHSHNQNDIEMQQNREGADQHHITPDEQA